MRKLLLLVVIQFGIFVSCTEDISEYDDNSDYSDIGLILHLPFNGDAVDKSGNNPEGIVHGALPTEDRNGNHNSAYYFDGSDDYIDVDTLPGLVQNYNSFLISFWVMPGTENTEWVTVFGSINDEPAGMAIGIDFHRDGDFFKFGRLSCVTRDSGGIYFNFAALTPEVFDNEWHHFAYNFKSMSENKAEIYVDGIKRDFTFLRGQSPQNFKYYHNPFAVGAGNVRGRIEKHFKGSIDDFRIYKEAFTEEQILSLYNTEPE
jgi:hypothetical protein